jgi:hypothetical protein
MHTGKKMHRRFCWEGHEERDNCEDVDVGGRMILKWVLEK